MPQPWFKFSPGAWRSDPALRSCPIAARGLWMEMLCIMHEAEPRGFLLINGRPVSDDDLAILTGINSREVTRLRTILDDKGVFSRDEHGRIFSRRMRRDDERASADKANGLKGGNPQLKRGVNPPDNGGSNNRVKPPDKAKNLEERKNPSQVSAGPFEGEGRRTGEPALRRVLP